MGRRVHPPMPDPLRRPPGVKGASRRLRDGLRPPWTPIGRRCLGTGRGMAAEWASASCATECRPTGQCLSRLLRWLRMARVMPRSRSVCRHWLGLERTAFPATTLPPTQPRLSSFEPLNTLHFESVRSTAVAKGVLLTVLVASHPIPMRSKQAPQVFHVKPPCILSRGISRCQSLSGLSSTTKSAVALA
jgi:hypothetical protein